MVTARVFISHSDQDEAAYSSLCLALDASGISRWQVSQLSPGKPLADGLRAAIEQCDVCVFLATSLSLKSQWCLAELGAFWGSGKEVIIYVADPTINDSNLPPQFRGNLWTSDASALVQAVKNADTGKIRRTASGYLTCLGTTEIEVSFGRLEDYSCSEDDCLIALPANEFFDDDCIKDPRSALGAFMQHHFRERISDIQMLVRDGLVSKASQKVEKRPGQFACSYNVGSCVFLDRPLSHPIRIAMVAVTTQRADVGLRANAGYIFEAMSSLQRVMANNRMRRLHIPIIGSGHGGLKGEVSLLCMLIALGDLYRKGHIGSLRAVKIVVFRRDENSPPFIPETFVRRALDFTGRFWVE